jgi:predicted porin
MKMAAIATAITTALVSGSALAAEVYNSDGTSLSIGGRAEFRGDFQGKASGAELKGTMDNASRFRVNVGGETKITNDLNGIGFYEAEQTVGNGADTPKDISRNTGNTEFKQRYMYAGLVAGDNTVTFGKQDAATVQISQMSDNVSTHSGIQKNYIAAGDEQINNALNYSGYFMDALSVKASLLAASDADQDGYALSGIYTLPMGIGIGLGYAANENPNAQDSTQFIGGLNYKWEGLYVAGTYTQGEGSKQAITAGDNDFTGYEFVAHYLFENNFQALVGYQKGEIDPAGASKYDISDYYELTGIYYFNSSLRTYATYKVNNLENADNSLRLALRYDF